MRNKLLDNRATAPHELLLIRAGHHLWRSYKAREYTESVALAALQSVWDAKEAVRVILRAEYLESRHKLIKGGSKTRFQAKQ